MKLLTTRREDLATTWPQGRGIVYRSMLSSVKSWSLAAVSFLSIGRKALERLILNRLRGERVTAVLQRFNHAPLNTARSDDAAAG